MTKPRRIFWIRPEGISRPCPNHAAVYTQQDLETAENKEFILEGIQVRECLPETQFLKRKKKELEKQ